MPYPDVVHKCWTLGKYRRFFARIDRGTIWRCPKCGTEWRFTLSNTYYGYSHEKWDRIVETPTPQTNKQNATVRKWTSKRHGR